ncbi:6-phosphogluconolactonase [Phenylobacterium sp. J426]|uniref:6-phosphogluconolactonase n=1 Tax=Phenylobacterium sp. J426 TaxID=2898439 RepID=UPI00215194A5|nr:6-phosphogluconolactonase [Phenylobacterium sp. J426]MCR5874209.1 6-phosphogluconolactonase [Phenylobacterium sp. J426]
MIETYPSAAAAGDACARAIADALKAALRLRGRASLVATGGRSPGPVFDALAHAPLAEALDWARVVVTLSDERCVEPTSPDANARAVRERLLVGPLRKAHFLPLWPKPEPAALAALMPFDAVMLGMGEDGHIASLIPGDPGLEAGLTTDQPVVDVPAGLGKPPLARVSLSLPAVAEARAVFLLIAGEAKREVLSRVQAGEDLPVGRLLSRARVPVRIFWSPEHAA